MYIFHFYYQSLASPFLPISMPSFRVDCKLFVYSLHSALQAPILIGAVQS